MVTIPTYKPGQVAARPVSTARRTGPGLEAFGANVGKAVQGFGGALGDAAHDMDRIAEQQAESAARTASIEAASRVREELWGEQGLMRQEGRKFIDGVDPTKKRLEEFRASFSGKGRNALESRMIEDTIRREIEPAFGQIDRTYVKAVSDENRATAAARTANLIDGSVQVFGNDQAWKENDAKLRGAIADEADAYGYDPETRKLKERQAYSRAYIYGISASLDADDTATAEKRFEEGVALGRLTGEAQVELKKQIDNAKNTVTAESFGMDVERDQAIPLDAGIDFKPPLANPVEPSSTYGPRKHPIDGVVKNHTGIDYPVPEGTPVLASAAGKVVEVKKRGGYGLMVRVDHGGGNETWYAHLSAASVQEGDLVKQGQRLAASGNSGKSTGPHLHYEVRHSGAPVDPTKPPPRVEPTLENLRSIALARSGGDPTLFKKLMAEGGAAIQRREAVKREREENLRDAVWKYAEKATSEKDIPRSLWNNLKPQDRDAFRSQIKSNVEGGGETDIGHYGTLMTLLSDRPKDFAQYSFETDTQLSTADKKAFIRQRSELRADTFDPKKRSTLEATNRAANLVLPDKMKKDDQERLKGVLFRAVADAEAAAGKQLDEKTIMDMAGRLSIETATANGKAPLYQAGVGGKKPATVIWSNIPVAVRTQLVTDYQKKFGRRPSAGEVADQYVMLKARGVLK